MANSFRSDAEHGLLGSAVDFLRLQRYDEEISQRAKENSPILFIIHLDVKAVLDYDFRIGELLLSKAHDAQLLFEEAVQFLLWQTELPQGSVEKSFLLSLRPSSLPPLKPVVLDNLLDCVPGCDEMRGLRLISGVVKNATLPNSYVRYRVLSCDTKGCLNANFSCSEMFSIFESRRIDLASVPCDTCGFPMKETTESRVVSRWVELEILPIEYLTDIHNVKTFKVVVRDDIVERINLGEAVSAVVVPSFNFVRYSVPNPTFECLNIVPLAFTQQLSSHEVKALWEPVTAVERLTPSLQRIWKSTSASRWSFILTLAATFGHRILPITGSHFRSRLCLLLSLVTTWKQKQANPVPPVSFLLLSSDSVRLERLMKWAASLSPKKFSHSPTFGQLSAGDWSNANVIGSGSILIAAGGVCLLGDVAMYGKLSREEIQHTLQTNEVKVFLSSGHAGDKAAAKARGKQEVHMKLSSSLWASMNPVDEVKRRTSSWCKPLVESFTLVSAPDNHDGTWFAKLASADLLRASVDGPAETVGELLQDEDWTCLFDVASQHTVTLDPMAEQLLNGYFVASRKLRNTQKKGSEIPLQSLIALNSTCVAIAQLSCRAKATEYDAALSVLLWEETLLALYQYSLLEVEDRTHIDVGGDLSMCMKLEEKFMNTFLIQLKEFVSDHVPECTVSTTLFDDPSPPSP